MPNRPARVSRKSRRAKKAKPIDAWLQLGGVAVGICCFLFAKTPLSVTLCAIAIFVLLIHPVWNFWWVDGYRGRQIFFTALLAIGCCLIGYAAWPEPPAAKTQVEPPDIYLRVISPKALAVTVLNDSQMVAKEITYSMILWDLDSEQPTAVVLWQRKKDWMRPRDYIYPQSVFDSLDAAAKIPQGHRLFGSAQVSCVDCLRTRVYWIYATQGEGGWFSEALEGHYPNVVTLDQFLPQVRQDPEGFFKAIPQGKQMQIRDFNPAAP